MAEETTFENLKKGLLELLRGYPDYRFFGKIEFYLKNGQSSIKVLDDDNIIELASKKEEGLLNKQLTPEQLSLLKKEGKEKPDCWYRLAPRGVDLAISMINLEHSERIMEHSKQTLRYSNKMKWFTITIIILGGLALLVGIIQAILTYRLLS